MLLTYRVARTHRAVGVQLVVVIVGLAFAAAASGASTVTAAGTSGVIRSVAGGGAPGDGGPPSLVVTGPTGVALDHSGDLLIADRALERVRMISPGADAVVSQTSNGSVTDTDDVITSVAGDGLVCAASNAQCGDGGPALSASMANPQSVVADTAGNVYVADTSDNRVRFVCVAASCATPGGAVSGGTVTTVAGTGQTTFNGDGAARTTNLNAPFGLAMDSSGNLFIAERGNQRVRELCLQTSCSTYVAGVNALPFGRLETVAGNGTLGSSGDGGPGTSATLVFPEGIAVDGADNVYIATEDQRIRRVAGVTNNGAISTVYDDSHCAVFCAPSALALGPGGTSLYIADPSKADVSRLDLTTAGAAPTVFAGSAGQSGFTGDGGPATKATLGQPWGVVTASSGAVFIADSGDGAIREVDPQGTIVSVTRAPGSQPGPQTMTIGNGAAAPQAVLSIDNGRSPAHPIGLASGPGGTTVTDTAHQVVRQVSAAGTITDMAGSYPVASGLPFAGDGGPATQASLNGPEGLAVDSAGNTFVADTGNGVIRRVDVAGHINTVAGDVSAGAPLQGYNGDGPAGATQLSAPQGLAVDHAGNVYIADSLNGLVREVSPGPDGVIGGAGDSDDTVTTIAGSHTLGLGFSGDGGPATQARLGVVSGVAVDQFGNVFIADTQNNAIREVDTHGTITTVAGSPASPSGFSGDGGAAAHAQLNGPAGIAVDAGGNLYIADTQNNAVRFVCMVSSCTSPSGAMTPGEIVTLAGNGSSGFSGDGGTASSAELDQPAGVAADPAGNVVIADAGNDRVREVATAVTFVAPPPPPTTTTPTPSPTPTPTSAPSRSPSPNAGLSLSQGGVAPPPPPFPDASTPVNPLIAALLGRSPGSIPALTGAQPLVPVPATAPTAAGRQPGDTDAKPAPGRAAGSPRDPVAAGAGSGAHATRTLPAGLVALVAGGAGVVIVGAVAAVVMWQRRRPAGEPTSSRPSLRQR